MRIGIEIIERKEYYQEGFDFECCPIMKTEYSSMLLDAECPNLTLDKLEISDALDARSKLGIIAQGLDLESIDECIRRNSEILFMKQVEWMMHCGVSVIGCYLPVGDCTNFSRVLNRVASKLGKTIMVLITPVSKEAWDQWNRIRMMSTSIQNLKIVIQDHLVLKDIKGWNAEPIRFIFFSHSIFGFNRNRNPYLSQDLCNLFWKFLKRGCDPIVSFDNLPGVSEMKKYSDYFNYLKKCEPESSLLSKITFGYEDYLQTPLQPLMDHLESATYEAFEMDPVKYMEYENAIYAALLDKKTELKNEEIVLAVVGAGRGPLVDRALLAMKRISGLKLKIYAVEKNPNAIITLTKKKEEWLEEVTVVYSDMRDWNPPEKVDIIVSELLGSFGDNELSPECLDGVQGILADTGIMIPSCYDAYVSPISSPKLYESILGYRERKNFETPFVVKLDQVLQLSDPIKLWTFEHPSCHVAKKSFCNLHNERYKKVTFEISSKSLMHGLAGYFEATLYKDITLSINPSTHSPGMFSWFPMFFPIHNPLLLTKDSILHVYFWRLTDQKRVWYEWIVESPIQGTSIIHNPNGQSFWIGL